MKFEIEIMGMGESYNMGKFLNEIKMKFEIENKIKFQLPASSSHNFLRYLNGAARPSKRVFAFYCLRFMVTLTINQGLWSIRPKMAIFG